MVCLYCFSWSYFHFQDFNIHLHPSFFILLSHVWFTFSFFNLFCDFLLLFFSLMFFFIVFSFLMFEAWGFLAFVWLNVTFIAPLMFCIVVLKFEGFFFFLWLKVSYFLQPPFVIVFYFCKFEFEPFLLFLWSKVTFVALLMFFLGDILYCSFQVWSFPSFFLWLKVCYFLQPP